MVWPAAFATTVPPAPSAPGWTSATRELATVADTRLSGFASARVAPPALATCQASWAVVPARRRSESALAVIAYGATPDGTGRSLVDWSMSSTPPEAVMRSV